MITGLLDLHSAIRYIALILLIISIISAYGGLVNHRDFSKARRRLFLATTGFLNFQMLLGLLLYFLKGDYAAWGNLSGATGMIFFFGIIHLIGMFIAITLVNMGYRTSLKKETDPDKFRRVAIFFSIGLILIFLFIPWPFLHSWATWF